MAPFYSGPLIGRQSVSGGRGAGCHVLCLMLCAVFSWRETVDRAEAMQLHLTAVLQGTQTSQAS